MNNYKVGEYLWVSRFSNHVDEYLQLFDDDNMDIIKRDVITLPKKFKVDNIHKLIGDGKEYLLELSAEADDSLDILEPYSSFSGFKQGELQMLSSSQGVGKSKYFTNRVPNYIKLEYDENDIIDGILNGGVSTLSNSLVITKKKSKNNRYLLRQLRIKHQQLKKERRYRAMRFISCCMMDLLTESQLNRLIEKNPEYYL